MPEDLRRKYDAFRGQLQYEDTLFNQRITWVIAFQALISFPFMFLTVSELQARKPNASIYSPGDDVIIRNYRQGIVFAGLFAGALGYVSCAAAHWRIRQLKDVFTSQDGSERQGDFPELDSPAIVRFAGGVASQGFLWGFFFLWTFVIFSDPRWFTISAWFIALTLYIGATASQGWRSESSAAPRRRSPDEPNGCKIDPSPSDVPRSPMKSLADGLPPEIARQVHPEWRKNEAAYWAVRDQLLGQYQGQWIGFADGAVVAAGTRPVVVFHAAHQAAEHPYIICVGREAEPYHMRRASFAYDTSYPGEALPVIEAEFRRFSGVAGMVLDQVTLTREPTLALCLGRIANSCNLTLRRGYRG